MATSRSFAEFQRRMTVRSDQVAFGVAANVKAVATKALTTVVLRTPVDTGQAISNYFVQFGSPSSSTRPIQDRSGAFSITNGTSNIRPWTIKKPAIYISNSLPYIVQLERGKSSKAPSGMMKAAVTAARAELGKIRIFK